MAPPAVKRKLVIVGDGACGKTSLLSVFALGSFPTEYVPTVFENYVAEIRLDGKRVQLALWDTAGQEEYERLRPLSYSKSHIILIAFSIDTPDSLENCTYKWSPEVQDICGRGIPVVLVGCKKDLRDEAAARGEDVADDRKWVTPQKAEAVRAEIGAKHYMECSALRMEGVDEIFEASTRLAMLVRTATSHTASPSNGGTVGASAGNRLGEKSDRRRSTYNDVSAPQEHSKGCCVIL